jgi:hypothetical protein
MMNERKNEMKVGDIVKSLDFVGHNNCYYVGIVTAIQNDGTFRADTIKRVWMGQIDTDFVSNSFVAPLPGNHFMDSDDQPRVVVIG